MSAMDAHAGFTIRGGSRPGTFTGDCECGKSYGDYGQASDLWDDMEIHRDEATA